MSIRARSQAKELDHVDETNLSPLSVLWLVNNIGFGGSAELSDRFILAILSAEIPLYFLNEDFFSENAFVEYRLAESAIAHVLMQVDYAGYDMLDPRVGNNWSDYFRGSVWADVTLSNPTVPLWFGATVPNRLAQGSIVETDEAVSIESLYVKIWTLNSPAYCKG